MTEGLAMISLSTTGFYDNNKCRSHSELFYFFQNWSLQEEPAEYWTISCLIALRSF
jgi:hypothetical protein